MAGAVALQSHQLYIKSYDLNKENIDSEYYLDVDQRDSEQRRLIRQGVFLLASGILCLINSVLYFSDVVWSIHNTLASL